MKSNLWEVNLEHCHLKASRLKWQETQGRYFLCPFPITSTLRQSCPGPCPGLRRVNVKWTLTDQKGSSAWFIPSTTAWATGVAASDGSGKAPGISPALNASGPGRAESGALCSQVAGSRASLTRLGKSRGMALHTGPQRPVGRVRDRGSPHQVGDCYGPSEDVPAASWAA